MEKYKYKRLSIQKESNFINRYVETNAINQDANEEGKPFQINLIFKLQVRDQTSNNKTLINLIQILPDSNKCYQGLKSLRKMLTQLQINKYGQVFSEKLMQRIFQFLRQAEGSQIQQEASWIVANLTTASKQQCQLLLNNGLIQLSFALLKSQIHTKTKQNLVWALGNISADFQHRNVIIKLNGLGQIIQLINKNTNKALINICAWTLSNLCRGNPPPKFNHIRSALPVFLNLLKQDILQIEEYKDCCWAVWHLCESSKNKCHIQVISSNLIEKLIQRTFRYEVLALPCLKIISTLLNSLYINQLQYVGFFVLLLKLLNNENHFVRLQVCKLVKMISEDDLEKCRTIVKCTKLLNLMSKLLSRDSQSIKKHILNIFLELSNKIGAEVLFKLSNSIHIKKQLSRILIQETDNSLICMSLYLLQNILWSQSQNIQQINVHTRKFDQFYDLLQKHSFSDIKQISQKSRYVLEIYFN